MKSLLSGFLLLVACLTLTTPPQARAETEVTFDYFFDALAPYGTWVEVEGYGPCWCPANVDADWAPYTEGQWVYTDAGWTWVGDEDFSGIVYHYGRWILAGSQGWCWVPGYDWGPGWVSWRDNDEYIGWAPLPPEVVWAPDVGVGIWVDEVYGIGPGFYSFCRHRDFGARRLRSVILARSWNTTIIIQTFNITNICFNANHSAIFCGGLEYDRATRLSNTPIDVLRLERRGSFDFRHHLLPRGEISSGTLAVVAPRILPPTGNVPVRPATTRVIGHDQVHRGWMGSGASGDLNAVRRKIHTETAGRTPQTDPVRSVTAATPQVFPTRNQTATSAVTTGVPAGISSAVPVPSQPFGFTPHPVIGNHLNIETQYPRGATGIPTITQQRDREAGIRQQNEESFVRQQAAQQQQLQAAQQQEALIRQRGAEAMTRRQLQITEQPRVQVTPGLQPQQRMQYQPQQLPQQQILRQPQSPPIQTFVPPVIHSSGVGSSGGRSARDSDKNKKP